MDSENYDYLVSSKSFLTYPAVSCDEDGFSWNHSIVHNLQIFSYLYSNTELLIAH